MVITISVSLLEHCRDTNNRKSNQNRIGGDYYAYRRAPLVLHLNPGNHEVNIRLIRDVRVMGGLGEPKISINLKAERSNSSLAIVWQKALIPDIVDNRVLATPFASVRTSPAHYFFVQADREHRDNVSVLPCSPPKGEKLTKRNTTGACS